MQQLPMKLKRICWITSVIVVIASAASAHLTASDLEQQILSAIARGEDISELVAGLPDARKAMPADSPPSELSVAATELDHALANLAQTLGSAGAKGVGPTEEGTLFLSLAGFSSRRKSTSHLLHPPDDKNSVPSSSCHE
jgi:hypothetical protein